MTLLQNSFQDGMDLVSPDTAMSPNSYRYLINARQRYGDLLANNSAIKITTAPAGRKQGIAAIGNVLILFVNGKAYWNEDGSTVWTQIANFILDTRIMFYTQAVPSSTFNFTRKLATTANVKDPLNVSVDFSVAGTPAGLIVQDGIHQPWIIFYDYTEKVFTARVTGTYSDWTQDNPEYVPIGKSMMFIDQILFIEAPDEQSVYRMVTGMPLNGMINIDVNGDKSPTESQGGATSTSFAFDFNKITALNSINIASSFIYATSRNVRVITLDYNNTIFGEPTFIVSSIIDAGIVNNYSTVEITGDYAFVDAENVTTFNAVKQLKWEGRNSPFSIALLKLLKYPSGKPIKQTEPIAFNFSNYSIFGLQSIWGYLYFVYDRILNKWVAIDSTRAGKITRFAIVETTTESKLYGINNVQELWWMYADTINKEVGILATRPYSSVLANDINETNLKIQHKSDQLKVSFKNGTLAGMLSATEYVDEQRSSDTINEELKATVGGINYPITPPVVSNNKQLKDSKSFVFRDGLQGRKLSYIVKWDNDAIISELQLTTSEIGPDITANQSQQSIQTAYGS